VGALVEQRKKLAVDVEDADLATLDFDLFDTALRDLVHSGDHMTFHGQPSL